MKKKFIYILLIVSIFLITGCSSNKMENDEEDIVTNVMQETVNKYLSSHDYNDIKNKFPINEVKKIKKNTYRGRGKILYEEDKSLPISCKCVADSTYKVPANIRCECIDNESYFNE